MPKTYVPPDDAPIKEWFGPVGRSVTEKGKWKKIEVDGGYSYLDNLQTSKIYSYVSIKLHGEEPHDPHLM